MTRALIVNADDYGLTPGVSAGIRQAHTAGLVTSTTVMMNMPAAAAELPRALAECPRLGLGVHLVLTAGQPVLPATALPSLMRLADRPGFPTLAAFGAGLARLDLAEVHAEWRAQIERFVRAAGRPPTHLDSHHHTAYFTPALFNTMLSLARQYGCAVRVPIVTGAAGWRALNLPAAPDQVEAAIAALLAALAAAPAVRHPDHFEPRFFGEHATEATLRSILAELPEGVTELMCHPGQVDPALEALSSYSRFRPLELAALATPGLRAAAEARGVRLIHFGDL